MKTLKINCQEGYEIDQDKSNLSEGVVEFKKKGLSYDDVIKTLFYNVPRYHLTTFGIDTYQDRIFKNSSGRNSKTIEQLESILALNKLCNVAKYLNDGWLPDWSNFNPYKWYLYIGEADNGKILVDYTYACRCSVIYFKSIELAEKAIEILGEEEIRNALTLNH